MASASTLLAYGGSKATHSQSQSRSKPAKKSSKSQVDHAESKVTKVADDEVTLRLRRQSPLASALRDKKKKPVHTVRRTTVPEDFASTACQDPKVLREYDEAIRRRDFQRVLWMIANGDVGAEHETRNGENAILAAVAAKNGDALQMLVDR